MLSLLSVAAAEICWQLEVDMGMAALLEVGCLSLGCLFQSILEVRQFCAVERRDVFRTSFSVKVAGLFYYSIALGHYVFKSKSNAE